MNVNNLKVIDEDFHVAISSKLISQFTSTQSDIEYFIALEKSSTYDQQVKPVPEKKEDDHSQIYEVSNRVARSTVAVIDTVVQRGGFKGEELTTIGQQRSYNSDYTIVRTISI